MNTKAREHLESIFQSLVDEGKALLATSQCERGSRIERVDKASHIRWTVKVRAAVALLGKKGSLFLYRLNTLDQEFTSRTTENVSFIEGLLEAIKRDMLTSVESLAFADAFGDLLEQANHLFEQGYHIAAAVIARAVVEEHLFKLCEANQCKPTRNKPTASDYYQSLYTANHISKVDMQVVQGIISVGNAAAHVGKEQPPTPSNVEGMLKQIPSFLSQHPLP